MSSILLANPFVSQQMASNAEIPSTQSFGAVSIMQPGNDSASAGDATSFSGSGSGQGGGAGAKGQQAVLLTRQRTGGMLRPQNATATSVVDAQAQKGDADTPATPLQSPSGAMDDGPGYISPSKFVEQSVLTNMPDPLPTSPFLKMTSVRD